MPLTDAATSNPKPPKKDDGKDKSHYEQLKSYLSSLNSAVNELELPKEIRLSKWDGLRATFILFLLLIRNPKVFRSELEHILGDILETSAKRPSIVKPPGNRLLAIVNFLYSPKTVELTFEPIVADMRKEYFDSLREGRVWKARMVKLRHRIKFFLAMGLSKILSLAKGFISAGR